MKSSIFSIKQSIVSKERIFSIITVLSDCSSKFPIFFPKKSNFSTFQARSILQNHHDYFALYILAQIEEESENFKVSIDLYKSILEGCPDSSIKESAGSKLAKCFQKINKHDEAVEALRDVVKDIRENDSIHSSHQSAHSLNR